MTAGILCKWLVIRGGEVSIGFGLMPMQQSSQKKEAFLVRGWRCGRRRSKQGVASKAKQARWSSQLVFTVAYHSFYILFFEDRGKSHMKNAVYVLCGFLCEYLMRLFIEMVVAGVAYVTVPAVVIFR